MEKTKDRINLDGEFYIREGSMNNAISLIPATPYEEAEGIYRGYCEEKQISAKLPYTEPQDDDERNTNAYHMMKVIVKNENGGKYPDAMNPDLNKYYSWFEKSSSGSGLSFVSNGRWYAVSSVLARLCSFTSSKAEELAKKFIAIYNILQT